jgi:hypothetical protein
MNSRLWWVHAHYSPQLVERWTYVSSPLLSHTPHRSRTGTTGWGAWRMLQCVRERSKPSSPSQLWVAGSLSPYDVIIYLFCIELLLYSKVVAIVSVPWFIICVRLGPSTPGDYVRARVPKTRVWHFRTLVVLWLHLNDFELYECGSTLNYVNVIYMWCWTIYVNVLLLGSNTWVLRSQHVGPNTRVIDPKVRSSKMSHQVCSLQL